jgi:hypothetical protein
VSTVVSAEPPDLLRCSHCGAVMQTPPPGLRADVVVLAMLRFVARHERSDGTPKARLRDDDGTWDRLHVETPRTGP